MKGAFRFDGPHFAEACEYRSAPGDKTGWPTQHK